MCGEIEEENENNSDPTKQFILEEEVIENIDDVEEQPLNPRQWYAPWIEPTHNRKVYDIDSSLDEANFEMIIYLNRKESFEEYVGYLDPKNYKKKKKKIFWTSERPVTTCWQLDVILLQEEQAA